MRQLWMFTYLICNLTFLFLLLSSWLGCWVQIHYSKQGQTFKSQAQSKHIEILQSPWLSELIAFHINLKETKHKSKRISSAFEECSLAITDGKPSLTCELFDSVKLDVDLTCSICLVRFWVFNFSPFYETVLCLMLITLADKFLYIEALLWFC